MPLKDHQKIRRIKILTFIGAGIFVLSFVFWFSSVSAQVGEVTSGGGDTFGLEEFEASTELASTDIRVIIAKIIRAVLGLLGVIALGIILYGGFTIMTSGGAEEKVTRGKKILINGVIGLVIILSALTITQFILNALGRATNFRDMDSDGRAPTFQSFIGSGALGRVIEDHYPERDQTEVKRNTMIAVTFVDSINPSSLIENTNQTCWTETGLSAPMDPGDNCLTDSSGNKIEYYGDCVEPPSGTAFSWSSHCDRLKTASVKIYQSPAEDTTELPGDDLLVPAVAIITPDADGSAKSFVFRPLDPLGNDTDLVWYSVRLTNEIKKALRVSGEQVGVFDSMRSDFYKWEFQTDTEFDFTPPTISRTYPREGGTIPRNSIIQVHFSEPVNPTVARGEITGTLAGFHNVIFDDTNIRGQWSIANGYQTIEFLANEPCGVNSCGDVMYCLQIPCGAGDPTCVEPAKNLVRTSNLISATSWEARPPWNGIVDMAGNALDGNKNSTREDRPSSPNFLIINEGEEVPDNFSWNYIIENKIDRTAPYINGIEPGVDGDQIDGNAPVSVTFSKQMWTKSLNGAVIFEYPDNLVDDDLWFTRKTELAGVVGGEKTKLNLKHREFGPNGLDLFYFTSVSSTAKSITQNCLYPGRGPAATLDNKTCTYTENTDGSLSAPVNCIDEVVGNNNAKDTGCAQTADSANTAVADTDACINILESNSNR